MRIKGLNKKLIIGFVLCFILLSVLTFSACGEFKSKDLTKEQAVTAFNKAITKAKTTNSLYGVGSNGQIYYADNDVFYSKSITDEECYECWLMPNDTSYVYYERITDAAGELVFSGLDRDAQSEFGDASSIVEYGVNSIFNAYSSGFDADNINVTAKKPEKNTTIISFERVSQQNQNSNSYTIEIQIKNNYIVKITTNSVNGETEQTQVIDYSYNVSDVVVPQLPVGLN